MIARCLGLRFWPSGLCFDPAWPAAAGWAAIIVPGALVVTLLGLTVWCVFRRPEWGFLGGWFC